MDTEVVYADGHFGAGGWAFTAQRYSFDPPGHLETSTAPEYGDFVEESSVDWVADCYYPGEDINLLEEQFDIGTLVDDTLSDSMAALSSALVAALGNIGKPVFNFQKTKTRPLKTNQLSLLAAEDVTETEEGGLSGKPDFSSALPWIT